MMQNKAKQSKK